MMIPGEERRMCVASTFANIRQLALFCRRSCEGIFTEMELMQIELGIVEAAKNVVEHAYSGGNGEPLELTVKRETKYVQFTLIDKGEMFDGFTAPEEFSSDFESLEDIQEGGYGRRLIFECMDDVSSFSEAGLNLLILKKNITKPSIQPNISCPFISKHTVELADQLIDLQMTRKEMAIATNMHKHLLSQEVPEVEGLKLYGRSESAMQIGGDYFTFRKCDDGKLWFMICDAMGKGISAGFFSVLVHTTFQSVLFLKDDVTPGSLLSYTNTIMNSDFDRFGMFMTALVGYVDVEQGVLKYASAGHGQPILYKNGEVEFLENDDFMLGVMDDYDYQDYTIPFTKGMKFLAYTDGITDIIDADGEMVGSEPLFYACATEFPEHDIIDSCRNIFADVMVVAENRLQDDVTIIGVEHV